LTGRAKTVLPDFGNHIKSAAQPTCILALHRVSDGANNKMSAWGKLHAAALELSKGSPLKQRLIVTFSKHLTQLEAGDLPVSMRTELRTLLEAFEAVAPLRGESAVQSTVRKMSNEQAEELAARVVTLFGHVARLSSPRSVEDPLRATDGVDDSASAGSVRPLFAVEA